MLNFKKSIVAFAVAASLGAALPVAADSATSNVVGTVSTTERSNLKIIISNEKTGFRREIPIANDGKYRFSKLPTGQYHLEVTRNGEIVAQQNVRVALGANSTADFELEDQSNVVQIVGARISPVDTSSTDSGLVLGEGEIDSMPIARNLTAVSLLAPGVVKGEGDFGLPSGNGFASFGGSSISENSCYINGLEVTNTRQGLGCGSVPFEFFSEFQVKTGGYSAQFGRTTGGVLNAVTKSGTNEWEFASTLNFLPGGLRESGSVSRGNGGTGTVFRDERNDSTEQLDLTLSASGPLIEDTLYIYAIVNPRDNDQTFAYYTGPRGQYAPHDEVRVFESSGSDNLFWGTKIDWDITSDHRLSLFAYSNRNDTKDTHYSYTPDAGGIDAGGINYSNPTGSFLRLRGGEASSLTYTGYFGADLSVSAMVGEIKTQYENQPSNLTCPLVSDTRTNPTVTGCGPGGTIGANEDDNKQIRLDVEYGLGDHNLKFGYDFQDRSSTRVSVPVAGHQYTYASLAPNASIQGQSTIYTNNTGASLDYVFDRVFTGGGGFGGDLSAYYVEDSWQITDDLVLNLGLRKDSFEASGTTGVVLTQFDTDIAPRLGFSYDVNGDGRSKLYGTWGRYYLPVANNTIFRAASGVSDVTSYYLFSGVDSTTGAPTGITPISGNIATSTAVNSIPVAPEQSVFQSEEADPFYKDEWIIGYETALSEDLTFTINHVFREVGAALDDYCGAFAYPYCLLVNPGSDATAFRDGVYYFGEGDPRNNLDPHDPNEDFSAFSLADGVADPGSRNTISAEQIGLPKANNEYRAINMNMIYNSEDLRWRLNYTWSRSTGNFEGAVKSDISQADAGITQDFDFPALMDGAFGYQPNDRRHVFKFFGSYDITEDFSMGLNATLSSGRPLSAFGQGYPDHNPDVYGSYGDTFYLYTNQCPDTNGNGSCDQGEKIYNRFSRGTRGRTPWTFQMDASAAYNFDISGVAMKATIDVFNVLNTQGVISQNEHYEARRSEGVVNQYYGSAYDWQTPRYIRLGLEARF